MSEMESLPDEVTTSLQEISKFGNEIPSLVMPKNFSALEKKYLNPVLLNSQTMSDKETKRSEKAKGFKSLAKGTGSRKFQKTQKLSPRSSITTTGSRSTIVNFLKRNYENMKNKGSPV